MIKELICICCPNGCHLTVDTEAKTVKGNTCPRGSAYGLSEVTHPVRVVTSTVKIEGAMYNRLPVKTATPVPKDKIFLVMDEINKADVKAPVKIGDIIIRDVCSTGSDVVATATMKKGEY